MLNTEIQILQFAQTILTKLDYPDYNRKVSVQFNSRFEITIADASYDFELKQALIRINPFLWNHASYLDKKNTIAHEICHIVSWIKYGSDIDPHGKEWKRLMMNIGYEPEINHSIQLKEFHKQGIKCDCGKFMISKKKFMNLINKKVLYTCKTCAKPLKLLLEPG